MTEKNDMREWIDALIKGGKSFEFRLRNNNRTSHITFQSENQRFCQISFYTESGEQFDKDFRDTPFHLPHPFPISSKAPVHCVKCLSKFTDEDFRNVTCYDEQWICKACKDKAQPETKKPKLILMVAGSEPPSELLLATLREEHGNDIILVTPEEAKAKGLKMEDFDNLPTMKYNAPPIAPLAAHPKLTGPLKSGKETRRQRREQERKSKKK